MAGFIPPSVHLRSKPYLRKASHPHICQFPSLSRLISFTYPWGNRHGTCQSMKYEARRKEEIFFDSQKHQPRSLISVLSSFVLAISSIPTGGGRLGCHLRFFSKVLRRPRNLGSADTY